MRKLQQLTESELKALLTAAVQTAGADSRTAQIIRRVIKSKERSAHVAAAGEEG